MDYSARQKIVYEIILENSIYEGRKTSLVELVERTNDKLIEINRKDLMYNYSDSTSHDKCPVVWSDINAINLSGEYEKVIILDDFTYWIGSKEETMAYLQQRWNKIRKALNRFYRMADKVELDGQGKTSNFEDLSFVEAFNRLSNVEHNN